MPVKRLLLLAALVFICPELGFAAEDQTGYLEYKDPVTADESTPISMFFYILSLVAAFLLVLASAYFVSRYLGGKMGAGGTLGNRHIVGVLPLTQNKSVIFLEVLDAVLVLGVTENNISLLKEVSAAEDVEKIKADLRGGGAETLLFREQSRSLSDLREKFGPLLHKLPGGSKGDVRK